MGPIFIPTIFGFASFSFFCSFAGRLLVVACFLYEGGLGGDGGGAASVLSSAASFASISLAAASAAALASAFFAAAAMLASRTSAAYASALAAKTSGKGGSWICGFGSRTALPSVPGVQGDSTRRLARQVGGLKRLTNHAWQRVSLPRIVWRGWPRGSSSGQGSPSASRAPSAGSR